MEKIKNLITLDLLKSVAPRGKEEILQGVLDNLDLLEEAEINTPIRVAHFLAQLAHESDGFHTTREYASGAAYEGRRDLGNVFEGDGRLFRGRGLIQLTGRANYAEFNKVVDEDLLHEPELVEEFPLALRAATWYWTKRGLNEYADEDAVEIITRKINGGYNGLDDRTKKLKTIKKALGIFRPDYD